MASSANHALRFALLAWSLLTAPFTTSILPAQEDDWAEFRRILLEHVAAAETGFSSYATSEARVVERDTVWSVRDEGCQLWARASDGSRDYRCQAVPESDLSQAAARSLYDVMAGQVRQALGTTWKFEEAVRDEGFIRRRLDATRADGIQVSLWIWEWRETPPDVQLQVSTPAPRPVARGEASAAPATRARTEFQENLLLAISDGEEDRFSFLAEDEGEVMDGDTVYPALPLPDSEWCDVWGYQDGSREYECVMMQSANSPEVERRYEELAAEIREALGSTWRFSEQRNVNRTLTARRNDGLGVELLLWNKPGDVKLVLTVVAR